MDAETAVRLEAHRIVFRAIAQKLWPNDTQRRLARKAVCDELEAIYENGEAINHDLLQVAIDEVERLFHIDGPLDERTL